MKIAVIAEFFYPAIGGQEQRLLEILEYLSMSGHEIDVYTIKYDKHLAAIDKYCNINIYRIIDDFNYKSGNGLKGRSIKTILNYSLSIIKYLKNNKYDKIIFSQFPILPIICTKLFNINELKILDFVEFRDSRFWRNIFKIEMLAADKVVCISNSVKNKAKEICNEYKLNTIPSSIKLDKFYQNNSEHFIFIGRMEEHKHPEDAIKTVMCFNKTYNCNYKLYLIGDGALLQGLKDKYKENDNIVFCGFVSEKEKIDILSKAITLIFPSEREGLPVSVIEAMAAGVPTLTTIYPNNGTADFVKEKEIGVVEKPEIKSLAESLKIIIVNHDKYVKNCIKQREEFSAETAALKFLAL